MTTTIARTWGTIGYAVSGGGLRRRITVVAYGNGFCRDARCDLPSGRVESPYQRPDDVDAATLLDDIAGDLPQGWRVEAVAS